jgi:Zn-dependent M28 family amino/carboxypeptidase
MFQEAGCTAIEEESVVRKDPPNIICSLSGTTSSLIVVGAHFDHAHEGAGAVDDWSGASLLPSLFQAVNSPSRKHTFVFVGFTDEEKGLVGSNYYVKHFSPDRLSTIKAMVNLECLGLAPTEVWAHVANPALLDDLKRVADSMKAHLNKVDVDLVGNDDTQAFRDKKIPVITIHSLTQETLPILHSAKDNLEAIHRDDFYDSYVVIAEYLAFLDIALN